MSEESRSVVVDSLVANEFEVELDGETLLGVFRVDSLTPFKLGDDGTPVNVPFRLVKMVQRDGDNAFNRWLRESRSGVRPTRTISVVAIDDGIETRRFTFNGAWISEVSYHTFDTALGDMVEEVVTINYESVEETWPAT
jgi:hypothetical protein